MKLSIKQAYKQPPSPPAHQEVYERSNTKLTFKTELANSKSSFKGPQCHSAHGLDGFFLCLSP
jgi:hypothetical protein